MYSPHTSQAEACLFVHHSVGRVQWPRQAQVASVPAQDTMGLGPSLHSTWDLAGDVVCGGLCIEFGLNGLSSCILGEGRCG